MKDHNLSVACLLLSSVCALAMPPNDPLSDARTKYVGQNVYVAEQVQGCYQRVGKISSIRLKANSAAPSINAMGEKNIDTNPELIVTLVCPGGKVTSSSVMLGGMEFAFHLLPDDVSDAGLASYLQEQMETLVATGVYPRDYETFYSMDSTESDLERENSSKRTISAGPDDPLAVRAVKVWRTPRGYFALLKLESESGVYMFAASPIDPAARVEDQIWEDISFGKPSCGTLAMRHKHEQSQGDIEVGESDEIVKCQYGRPDHVNSDDSKDQWVYEYDDGSTEYVYISHHRVIGLQHQSP